MTQFIILPKQAKDITGQRFGKLVALGPVGRNKTRSIVWLCRCDCGNTTKSSCDNLTRGHSQTCGCGRDEHNGPKNHGLSGTRIHKAWVMMKQRCANPNREKYPIYGGRGIAVCNEWQHSFQSFYDHVSQLPNYGKKGYTLDRINNEGNYEPGNVRWADWKTQANNRRSPQKQSSRSAIA